MDDFDIYGDLTSDLPAGAPAASLAPSPPPVMSPPPGSPPPGGPPVMSPPPGGPPGDAMSVAGEEFDFTQGYAVDGGVVQAPIFGDSARSRPKDVEALNQELREEERATGPRPGKAPGAEVEEILSDNEGGDIIELDTVRASDVSGAQPRHRAAPPKPAGGSGGTKRKEVSLFIGQPPPAAPSTGSPQCLVLVGGLPWWISDSELRKQAEQFGQVRAIRILDFARSGKSAGIALVEYADASAVTRATDISEGLRALPAWEAMAVKCPRLVLVSPELFEKVRSGVLPWPEGGPCSDHLRDILARQFDISHIPSRGRSRSRDRNRRQQNIRPGGDRGPPQGSDRGGDRGGDRRQSNGGQPARAPSPEAPVDTAWADKLKALRGTVSRRNSNPHM